MMRIISYICLFITSFIATSYLTCSTIASIADNPSTNKSADRFLTALHEGETIYPQIQTPPPRRTGQVRIAHCTPQNLAPHAYDSFPATVLEVIDGDTLRVAQQGNELNIRLWGIDAPEIDQPLGPRAKEYLATLTPPDSKIIINPIGLDHFGRLIATIGDRKSPSPNFVITAFGWAYHMNAYDSKANRCLQAAEKSAKKHYLN